MVKCSWKLVFLKKLGVIRERFLVDLFEKNLDRCMWL